MRRLLLPLLVVSAFRCGGDSSSEPDASIADSSVGDSTSPNDGNVDAAVDVAQPPPLPQACNGSVLSTSTPATGLPAVPSQLTVASGFKMEVIASIGNARELAALPNGDLLVATNGSSTYIVPNAEADGAPGVAAKFATDPDAEPAGIAYDPLSCTIYLGTNQGVYSTKYADGQLTGTFGAAIAKVRQGSVTPNSDGDVHKTTSVAFSAGKVYAAVGSGCNACTEVDPTRATIQVMDADGSNMTTRATRIRNAIALATNPATGMVWGGGAGQDDVCNNDPSACPNGTGHPYEFFDAVTLHAGTADYGWPECEENHNAFGSNADCSNTVAPLIELPAYSTLIGAAFYPTTTTGSHAFASPYRGGVFIAAHGSWHTNADGSYFSSPLVVFVAMNGDAPATPVNWNDPTKQWTTFIGGWQDTDSTTRHGRPTGVAVGSKGSLFIGDDANGYVYRVRPN
jgi:glucose/arabinose dehydrogenase